MKYVATVIGPGVEVTGSGDTPEEAVEDLRVWLERFAEAHADLGNADGETEH
jgi:hypothetical protein